MATQHAHDQHNSERERQIDRARLPAPRAAQHARDGMPRAPARLVVHPWSLLRERAPQPVEEHALDEAGRTWSRLTTGLDRRRRRPVEWSVPRRPDFEPGQRFGPLTPLVVARGAQLLQADAETLEALLTGTGKVRLVSVAEPITRARVLARRLGRSEGVDAVAEAVPALVACVTGGSAWSRFIQVHGGGSFAHGHGTDADEQGSGDLAELLRAATLGCLGTQAVADVAEPDLLLHAFGPWEAAQHVDGVAGLMPWRAAPHVVDVVRALLSGRGADTVNTIGLLHDTALRWESAHERARRYSELESRLTGWALTSPAACSPVMELLEGTQTGEQLRRGAGHGLGGSRLAAVQEWATCVTAALTHRQRLTAEEVQLFAWPVRSVLPGLERVLNTPI